MKKRAAEKPLDLHEIGLRIKGIRESLKLNQNQFALKLGASQSFLSYVEKGGRKPSVELLSALHECLDANIHYVLTGEGEMFSSSPGGEGFWEVLHRGLPGIPRQEEVLELIGNLEVPVIRNALVEKYLVYRYRYKDLIREYREKEAGMRMEKEK